ncbi:MAG: hypothetical protein V4843_13035 [Pseudomonadota bacterium]
MIIPSQTIRQLCEQSKPPLIDYFEIDNLRASSYDLTVGTEYYIGQERATSTLHVELLKRHQSFSIPPHAVCFILSAESINLPDNITAKVSLRMSHIYAGLVLTAQPPFDPRYEGKVIVMLHNLSSDAVHMKNGDRLATIEFMRVELAPHFNKPHRSVHGLEGQLSKPVVSSLGEIARRSDSAHDKVNWMASQMLIFVALIVAVLAVPGFFSFNSLLEKTKEQDAKLEKLAQQLDEYKRDLELSKNAAARLESKNLIRDSKLRGSMENPANAIAGRVSE